MSVELHKLGPEELTGLIEMEKVALQSIEEKFGRPILALVLAEGLRALIVRAKAYFELISSPDSPLSCRIQAIIHAEDPEAAINFQFFDQVFPQSPEIQKVFEALQRGLRPLFITYRGNLPVDIEDRISAEIKKFLDATLPGVHEHLSYVTMFVVRLPAESEESS